MFLNTKIGKLIGKLCRLNPFYCRGVFELSTSQSIEHWQRLNPFCCRGVFKFTYYDRPTPDYGLNPFYCRGVFEFVCAIIFGVISVS